MKNQVSVSAEELLMPVTQHIMEHRDTAVPGRQTVDFKENGTLSNWLKENDISYFSLFLSAYIVFINRLTGSKDVALLIYSERENSQLPFKLSMDESMKCIDILNKVKTFLAERETGEINNAISVPDIQKITDEPNKMTFTFIESKGQNAGNGQIPRKRNLDFRCYESEGKYSLDFFYDSSAFSDESIARWLENIKKIIHAFLSSNSRVLEIDILSDKESDLYKVWNNTNTPYEKNLCVHDKLIAQAQATPDKIALFCGSEAMSYCDLNKYSDAFANYLIKSGVQTGDRVAVCLDRCLGLMVSIFGILKAGAAYMPVSPKFPVSRISEILIDAEPILIVKSKGTGANIPDGISVVDIDMFMSGKTEHDFSVPEREVSSNEVAYIIYTSGTTGKPKGVMIEHHSVLNRIGWMQKSYPLTSEDILIQKTPVTFDVSIWELFWWSFTGAAMVLLEPDGERSPEVMLKTIKKYGVTVIHFVPSMFSTFLAFLDNSPLSDHLSSLHTVFCSGEALTTTVVDDFYKYCRKVNIKAEVVNLYGPTEATVDVSYFNCPQEELRSVPIGKPIDNTQLFVVNDLYSLQPLNMPGELLICGVNLARGYYNNVALTDEKFIELDIFGKRTRAYKTGDLTYWSDDGNIYYIGRADNQIKLRGMRIELGEIESKVLLCPDIKYCVVLLVNPGTDRSYLAAFYQTVTGSKVSESNEIKNFLSPHLPEYKIPSVFREIKEIPLSINGKVDRKVLLSYLEEKPQLATSGSTNSNEKRIFDIWTRILKKDNFNLTSNFFEIGGNSLLLVQLSILLKKEFKKDINAMTILQNPTIKSLAKYLSTLS